MSAVAQAAGTPGPGLRDALAGSWLQILAALLLATAGTIASAAMLLASLHAAADPADRGAVTLWAAGAGLVALGLGLGTDTLTRSVQLRVEGRVERSVWHRLMTAEPAFVLHRPLRELIGWAGSVGLVRTLLSALGVDTVLAAAVTALASTTLFLVDPLLGTVSVVLVVLMTAAALDGARRQQLFDRSVLDSVDRIQALLHPAIRGIDELAGYRAQAMVLGSWAAHFATQKDADGAGLRRAAPAEALLAAATPVLLTGLSAAVVLRGGPAVHERLVLVVVVSTQLAVGCTRLAAVLPGLFAVALARHRLRPLLASPAEQRGSQPGRLSGAVRLVRVDFTYPGASRPVVHDVDLEIAAGECVALVGASGSGKSTILKLLLGLHRPDAGRIEYDGMPLGRLDPIALRQQIGYVAQAGTLLRGSVRDVIRGSLGAASDAGPGAEGDDATDADILAAADLAGIGADIRALPMGLDTRVTDTTAGFSGGQVQRLLLARALHRRPRLLLLDEATSALDDEVQRRVVDSVAALAVTRVVVAHRLSTIRGADRVVLMSHGRIRAIGTYAELMDTDADFRVLVGSFTPPQKEYS